MEVLNWSDPKPLKRGQLSGIPKAHGIYRIVTMELESNPKGGFKVIYIVLFTPRQARPLSRDSKPFESTETTHIYSEAVIGFKYRLALSVLCHCIGRHRKYRVSFVGVLRTKILTIAAKESEQTQTPNTMQILYKR
mgnify:CR=1 FL=1